MLVNTSLWKCKKEELHISSIPSGYPALNSLPISTYNQEAELVLACFLIRSQSCSGFGRVFAVLCLCLARASSEKKWVGDTSLCPIFFMLYQNRGAGRHQANLLWLPTWQMDFFSDKQFFYLLIEERWQDKDSLIWRKEDLRIDRVFFSLCVRSVTSWVAPRETNLLLSLPAKELRNIKWKQQDAGLKTKLKEPPLHIQHSCVMEVLTARHCGFNTCSQGLRGGTFTEHVY